MSGSLLPVPHSLPEKISAVRRGFDRGEPLPLRVREWLDPVFGPGLAEVRVHVEPESPLAGARAFTIGRHIFFGANDYDPETESGLELLAHELTHVRQQQAGLCGPQSERLAVLDDSALESQARAWGRIAARRARGCLHGERVPDWLASGSPTVDSNILQCSPAVGDRVRVKATKVFGIVSWVKTETSVELWVLGNDLNLGRVMKKNSEIEADAALPLNATYVNREETKANMDRGDAKIAYARVVEHQNVATPALWTTRKPPRTLGSSPGLDKFLSAHAYRFEGGDKFVNGAYVSKNPSREIAEVTNKTMFFEAVERKVPLIHIPQEMQAGDFCLAYRGDTREPIRVFVDGFDVWEDHSTPVFRTVSDEGHPHYDILSPSGVCASGKPAGGCIFPLIEPGSTKLNDEIYLYGFFAYQPFQTCRIQERLASSDKLASDRAFIENLLNAEEIVVGKGGVPGETVVGGCKIRRKWHSDNWVDGAELDAAEFYFNRNSHYVDDPAYPNLIHLFEKKVRESCKHTPVFTA